MFQMLLHAYSAIEVLIMDSRFCTFGFKKKCPHNLKVTKAMWLEIQFDTKLHSSDQCKNDRYKFITLLIKNTFPMTYTKANCRVFKTIQKSILCTSILSVSPTVFFVLFF